VLSGLEAVGQVPDLTTLGKEVIAQTLNNIEQSLSSLFLTSYFITAKMDVDLNNGPVNGVLPLLYFFLARSGKVIHDVQFVDLDRNGSLQLNYGFSWQHRSTRSEDRIRYSKPGDKNVILLQR
jgi:hypothetical protein